LLSLWCVWFCGKKVEENKIVKIDGWTWTIHLSISVFFFPLSFIQTKQSLSVDLIINKSHIFIYIWPDNIAFLVSSRIFVYISTCIPHDISAIWWVSFVCVKNIARIESLKLCSCSL
jgi:hypothetical protein